MSANIIKLLNFLRNSFVFNEGELVLPWKEVISFFFLVLDKRIWSKILGRLVSSSQGKFFSTEGLFLS